MSKNIVTRGLGGPLLITEGYGRSGAVIEVTDSAGAIILDHWVRTQTLFVSQFRALRDVSQDTVTVNLTVPDHTPVSEVPATSAAIPDHVAKAKTLFVTQFRRQYAY